MSSLILKCILFFTILYLFVEVVECKQLKRHDVHRIILKTKNKERFKEPRHLHPVQHYHHHSPKEFYLPNREQYLHHVASNSFRLPRRNRYKDYKHFRKLELSKFQPQSEYENSYFGGQYSSGNSKYLATPSGNDYITNQDYERHNNIGDSYNKKQKEEFQNQLRQTKKHAKQQYQWYGSDESSFQEGTGNDLFETSNSDKVQAIWKPSSDMESKNSEATYNKIHDIGYIVDFTTSKPQKLPITIIEHQLINHTTFGDDIPYSFGENIHSNHKHTDHIFQNDEEPFKVTDEATIPLISTFQNLVPVESSYSTLPEQYTKDTFKRKKKKEKLLRRYEGIKKD